MRAFRCFSLRAPGTRLDSITPQQEAAESTNRGKTARSAANGTVTPKEDSKLSARQSESPQVAANNRNALRPKCFVQ